MELNTDNQTLVFYACLTEKTWLRNLGCNALSKLAKLKGINGIGAFVMPTENNKFKISMRSNSDEFDLDKISRYFGGGGHSKAASFICDKSFLNKAMKSTVFKKDEILLVLK